MNYLVYKISGGLCHMMRHINFMIHLSKVTGRRLIIDCNAMAFSNDFNKYFTADCDYQTDYRDFPEEYTNYARARLIKDGGYLLLDKRIVLPTQEIINSRDRVVFCTMVQDIHVRDWYIKVKKDITEKIAVDKIQGEYIGVHFRNTDRKNEISLFEEEIKRLPPMVVYFATDDAKAVLNIPNKVIRKTYPGDFGGASVHYGNPDKDEVIFNALTDLYHLSKATYFIPSMNSSFSQFVLKIREKDEFFMD